ncbi:hypothetical protein CLU79DRAFT_754594 [Phycomyces nitens]|nr:hypothetical protein CLU79DRAFT_754594 [Phycomyces nitens]
MDTPPLTRLTMPSVPPPPYTPEYIHPQSPSADRVPDRLVPDLSRLELRLVASTAVSQTCYECSCVLDNQFLLLGHAVHGIQVIHLPTESKPKPLIRIRARDMLVLESCRTLLIIAGRYKQVRCYSLDAILKLCCTTIGLNSSFFPAEKAIPTVDAWQNSSTTLKKPSNNISRMNIIRNSISSDNLGCSDGLLECYYKFPDSKDALGLYAYHTRTSVFVTVLHKNELAIWQRKQGDQLELFSRLKNYWLPKKPVSISFADDRSSLRLILPVFPSEASVIDLRDNRVYMFEIKEQVEELYKTGWQREQLNISTSTTSHNNTNHSPRSPTIPLSFMRPSNPTPCPLIQWSSLVQLPFYPDNLPATSVTTEYSIPPTYATVVSTAPSESPDPVVLPSTSAPRLFFATLGKQSFILDISGGLFSTQSWVWQDEPEHIEFMELEANDWCAVGFCRESVDVVHLKTGQRAQPVMAGLPIRYLGKWEYSADKIHSQSKTSLKGLFWSCSSKDKVLVYMLRANQ